MLFDFGAASVSATLPLQLRPEELQALAGSLAHGEGLVERLRHHFEPLFTSLQPAMTRPNWSELSEEYFVFQFERDSGLPDIDTLMRDRSSWVASLVRLEGSPLSVDEVQEALRASLRYGPEDLVIVEWPAAVVVDSDCEETLQTIEFANLELLEFRYLDRR